MKDDADSRPLTLSIAAVERDTGLSKDALRVWERRYGFPRPERDPIGERAYPLEQVEKLRIIKRLLDAGHRPGQIVPLPLDQLRRLVAGAPTPAAIDAPRAEAAPAHDLQSLLGLLSDHDVDGFRRQLARARVRLGLARLVTEVVAPLNTLVGDAWMRGQIEIYVEHAYTESVQALLREAIATTPRPAPTERPRVLLTTLPGEPHGLGLLMAEAMLAAEGAWCVSLGVQTPVWDVVLAAAAFRCDVVALSFTGCTNPNQVLTWLTELRRKLPASVDVWVGGNAPVLHRRHVAGVVAMDTLGAMSERLERWRSQVA